jgi:glycosyltransferase involved in cell wall biosynthesis
MMQRQRPKNRQTQRVFIDLTHLGRHVTGIERVSIEQFEAVDFNDADVTAIRSSGTLSMIFRQHVWLPLLALLHPTALFVFPGFPPSPLFAFARDRVIMYVHDLFLITRRCDLGWKAFVYMAWPFSIAVRHLKRFQVNSEKTRGELAPFVRPDAAIQLYRPAVRNVFDLVPTQRRPGPQLQIATLGTVEPRKNYGAMIPILDALAELGIRAELHIVGREGWGDAITALANDPRVKIYGYLAVEEVKAVLEAADVYLCTSHDEGLGLPLLEAQYAGLAVIAPDKRVFREVLGSSATFIDPSDAHGAAAAISALISTRDWQSHATGAAVANVARWNGLASLDAEAARTMFSQPVRPEARGGRRAGAH